MSIPFTALSHQQEALDEIIARAKAYYAGNWQGLPIKPRWHSLVCGPTGVGKTALAMLAAEATEASLLRMAAPSWMPAGATQRGIRESIAVIAEHISCYDRTLLVIDEIDKLIDNRVATGGSSAGSDSWRTYIRGEIYDLTDGRWPTGLKPPEDDNYNETSIDVLTTKLRDTVFIMGIGTFQDWYDHASSHRSLGFAAEINPKDLQISAEVVSDRLPRELSNRFNTDLIRIPDLGPDDYHRIADEAEASLPKNMKLLFRSEVCNRIQSAIDAKKGVRFLEECMMQALKKNTIIQAVKTPSLNL